MAAKTKLIKKKKAPAKKKAPVKKQVTKEEQPPAFKTVTAAHKYLVDAGYKIGSSRFSEDVNKKRFVPKQKGGLLLLKDVLAYVKMLNIPKHDGSTKGIEAGTDKMSADTRLTNVKTERLEFQLEIEKAKYVLKTDLVQELASRASTIKETMGVNFINRNIEEIIRLCGGDVKKAPDVIALYVKSFEEALHVYSVPMELDAPQLSEDFIEGMEN